MRAVGASRAGSWANARRTLLLTLPLVLALAACRPLYFPPVPEAPPFEPGVRVVDTTGAGDAYAAGFLYAYTHGHELAACGRMGSVMAAEVISHYGARPEADVRALAGQVFSQAGR